ncbi:MAG: TonB-dependent receptor plug domain-containing protein [Bacteroidia bacterium]
MNRFLLLLSCLLLATLVQAQSKYTVSGTVRDQGSGELMIGVVVKVLPAGGGSPVGGANSNDYGFYSITLPEGDYLLRVDYLGYDSLQIPLSLHAAQRQDLALQERSVQVQDVVITGQKGNENVTDAQMGVVKLDMKTVAKVPVIFGERDVLKTLQLMPGVKSTGEGSGGLYVRGGESSQNLILLDEAPVYNAYHLLGFFSTFNADAIKDVSLYKGTAPAQYGGRLSSVIDVKMNDGNNQKYHVSGGIGLIASHLNVEGPIVKDKGSFLLTGRRTYADVFLNFSDQFKGNKLYFYDLNGKASYNLNDKNRLYLSGYFGRDKLGLGAFGIDWGNMTGTLRWNHLISSKWFSNTSLIFSDYSYKVGINTSSTEFSLTSRIRDYNVKQEFQYFASPKHTLRMGFNAIHHTVTPGQVSLSDTATFQPPKVQDRQGIESAAFFAGEWEVSTRLHVDYGIRGSMFNLLGGGNFYGFDEDGNVQDTTHYDDWSVVKSFLNPEPRLSMSYTLGASNSLKAAYTRNAQYLHMVTNATSTTPTDVWLLSTNNVKPELSDQVSLGYFHNFKEGMYETSAEVYYKQLYNQLDLRNGADIQANEFIEGELVSGKGRAYGLELYAKKTRGDLTGWVSYTLSRTERNIATINDGNWYPAKQDALHDLSVVAMYDISKRVTLAGTFVFRTGNAVTFPTGKYIIDGQVTYLYTERNGYRMPDYHRMDLSLTVQGKPRPKYENSWNFACYNVYGRQNAYSIDFQDDPDDPTKTQAVKTALFRWVPSITYNFKF